MPSRSPSSSGRRSNYSSVRRDPVAERAKLREKTEMKNKMRNYRKEAALKGRALMEALKKKQPKNYEALQKTGQLAVQKDGTSLPLPGNFLRTQTTPDPQNKYKKIKSYKDIAERSYELSGWIIGQMSTAKFIPLPKDDEDLKFDAASDNTPAEKSKAKPKYAKQILEYDLVTLVQYIPEPLDRERVLDQALVIALEEEDPKLLRRVVAAGIDYKINGPLDYVVGTMSPTEHLKFLQNKMLVPDPLDDDLLLPQFDLLQDKIAQLKPVTQKKIQAEINKIHPHKKARTDQVPVKTQRAPAMDKKIAELQQFLQSAEPGMTDDNEIGLRFETLDADYIAPIKAAVTRSRLYQQLGTLYPVTDEKAGYYRQSINAASAMKDGTAKAQRFKELRDDVFFAPGIHNNVDLVRMGSRCKVPSPYAVRDADTRTELHRQFAQNATLTELMVDGIQQIAKKKEISDYTSAHNLVSSRDDDPHHQAFKAQSELVAITQAEIKARLPKMNITQKRVFEKHKAAFGYL